MLRVSQFPGTKVAAAIMLALALVGVALAAPAVTHAASSEGCDSVNLPVFDRFTGGGATGGIFSAGDYLTMTAAEPSGLGPLTVELQVDSVIVASTAYPGTVQYTIPATGTYNVFWYVANIVGAGVAGGFATWSVSCVPGSPIAPMCDGQPATIYVNEGGRIVGGPDNGKLYAGQLNGTGRADVIVGTDAKDQIEGRAGNDLVCAGAGNDVLEGGRGNDRLTGGPGADRFRGGRGNDTATDFTPAQGDTKASVENFEQPV